MHLKHTSKLKAELVCSFRKKICSSSTLHLSYCRSILSFSFELPFKLSTTGASHYRCQVVVCVLSGTECRGLGQQIVQDQGRKPSTSQNFMKHCGCFVSLPLSSSSATF
jgi:hypothetical protein